MATNFWMKDAVKHPGALHQAMGVPKGQKIPSDKISKRLAELKKKSKGDRKLSPNDLHELQMLTFAETAKKVKRGK